MENKERSMREDICSIPVNDIFAPKDGCPFCRMRDMLEDRMATYITGAAMMEPDVRVETNHLGFCKTHFDMILERGSRLSVALILETLLLEVEKDILPEGDKVNLKKTLQGAERRENSCFVCENVDKNMEHLCSSVIKMWQVDEDFRQLYAEQTHICASHYPMIMKAAAKMPKKNFQAFAEVTTSLTRAYLREVKDDVSHFCKMFDYRNAGGDWGNSRDSIERAIQFLTARPVTTTTKTEGKNR